MAGYVGRGINYGNAVVDHFTGNGGATYTLTYDTTTDGVVISLDGVVQKNGTDFNIAGTALTFTSVVASPIAIQVIYTGLTQAIGVPSDNTVSGSKIAMGSDAQGDTLYYNGTDYVRLPKGTASQVLKMNSGATAPEWAADVDTTNTNASNLVSGTLPDARFPATLPASSGANLTALPAGNLTGTIDNARISLDAAEIPSLDTAKVTSGTFADARISSSSVTQHVTGYNDATIKADILKLAIHQAVEANRTAYNLTDSFIDGFEDDTGITTQTTVDRDTDNEYVSAVTAGTADYTTDSYASGNRTSLITVTRSSSPELFSSTAPSNNNMFVDGVTNSGNAYFGTSEVGGWLKFDFGSGVTRLVTGLRFWLTNGYAHDFKLEASNDDTNWTTIGSSVEISGGGATMMPSELWTGLSHTTKYRYYRIYETAAGTTTGGDLREVEFKIVPIVVSATGTLISDPQTASSSRTSISGVIVYEDSAGTATLGTDLKIYFTANNGSNWTEASSYATAVTYSGTKKLVTLGSTTVTAGTQIAIKAVWANQSSGSKETRLHGWAANY